MSGPEVISSDSFVGGLLNHQAQMIIELRKECDELESRAERAEAERDQYFLLYQNYRLDGAPTRAALQSTIAELTAQLSASSFQVLINRAADAESRAAVADAKAEMDESRIAELTATVERMRDFVSELADEECHYADNCPPFINTRHGTCLSCRARAALGEP